MANKPLNYVHFSPTYNNESHWSVIKKYNHLHYILLAFSTYIIQIHLIKYEGVIGGSAVKIIFFIT